MVDLADRNYLVSGATSEAQFQTGIGALYDYVAQLLPGSAPENVVISAGGSITPLTKTYLIVDTENTTAADNLDNILATNVGQKLIGIHSLTTARVPTLRHMKGGTGQIYLLGEVDVALDNQYMFMVLRYNPTLTRWEELWRNFGLYVPTTSAKTAARTSLLLGTAALANTGTGPTNIPLNSNLGALAYKATIDSASLLAAGVVTNGKIASGSIDPDRMSVQTANSVLAYNASGVALTVSSPSDTGKRVLMVDNNVMSFQTLPETGGLIPIDIRTLGADATSIEFTLSNTYDDYVIQITRLGVLGGSSNINIQYMRTGQSTYDSGSEDYTYQYEYMLDSTTGSNFNVTTSAILLASGATNSYNVHGKIELFDMRNGSNSSPRSPKHCRHLIQFVNASGQAAKFDGQGFRRVGTNSGYQSVDKVKLYPVSDSFKAGSKVTLFGVKK